MLQRRICNLFLPREGNSAFKSLGDHGFTEAWTASFGLATPLSLGFPPIKPDTAFSLVQGPTLLGSQSVVEGSAHSEALVKPCTGYNIPGCPWRRDSAHNVHVHEWWEAVFSLKVMVVSMRPKMLVALALPSHTWKSSFPCALLCRWSQCSHWQWSWEGCLCLLLWGVFIHLAPVYIAVDPLTL